MSFLGMVYDYTSHSGRSPASFPELGQQADPRILVRLANTGYASHECVDTPCHGQAVFRQRRNSFVSDIRWNWVLDLGNGAFAGWEVGTKAASITSLWSCE